MSSIPLKDPKCSDSSSGDSEQIGRSLFRPEKHVCVSGYCLPVGNDLSAYWLFLGNSESLKSEGKYVHHLLEFL